MSDFLDLQGAKDLNTDAIHIGAVANSVDPVTGAQIDTHVNREGGTDYTLKGFWNALGPVVMPWTSVTGGTLTQPNQAFLHPADGNYYSWGGAFPKVVAPGTNPTAVTGYVPRTDVLLRSELADIDSDTVIAGELAADVARASRGDDYTHIQDSAEKIANLFVSANQSDKSIVITGDSLSFVGFGYPAGLGINGAGYATDNPFGMSSWAHMIRDAILTSHPSFTPVDMCQIDTDAALSWPTANSEYIKYGINAKVTLLTFSSTSKVAKMSSGYSGSKALIVSYAPAAEACLFDVNGVSVDNTSPDGAYQNRGYMIIQVSNPVITITNVRKKSDGTAGTLAIYGCGSPSMSVAKLTGKGAWTSGQILAEYSTLVAPYSPDIIFYIIGANDIAQSVPIQTFSSNVRSFIANARAAKPGCEIVLLSTPPSSSYARGAAKPYIKEMLAIAKDTGSSLIDLWSKLEGIPTSEWRFDNIHFNTNGDTLVFGIVKKLIFPCYDINKEKFTPTRELYLGAYGYYFFYGNKNNRKNPVTVVITCGSSPLQNFTYPSSRGCQVSMSYVTRNGLSALDVTFPSGAVIESITPLVRSFGASGSSVALYEVLNERRWVMIGIDASGNQVALSGSNLLFCATATLLSTL